MQIEEILAQLESTERAATSEWTARLSYESAGRNDVGFPRAIVVRVDSNPEHVFRVPEKLGKHEMEVNLSSEVQSRSKIYLEIETYSIHTQIIDVKSTARVILKKKGATVLDEKYSSDDIWYRKTFDEILC